MYADSRGTSVTTIADTRITSAGKILRQTKIDEIPQLVNVLSGDMSLVGPRPDVSGFADELQGDDRAILSIRPGITGPATLLFAEEEAMLANASDPESFNADVLYPLKTSINRAWMQEGTLVDDLRILLWTVKRPDQKDLHSMILRWNPSLELNHLAALPERGAQ